MTRPLTIGALARATGVPAKTIRYYEQVKVLPAPRRSPSGYRQYAQRDVHRLLFIRRARALGLSFQDLRALTAELDNGQCGTMRPQLLNLVRAQLHAVEQQLAEFQLLHQQLEQVLHRLLTAPPSNSSNGCQCLESNAALTQQTGSQPSCTSELGANTMTTPSTLESLTIVPTTSAPGVGDCGCGCGCPVPQLSVLPTTVESDQAALLDPGDGPEEGTS
ncbi:MAG: MerR family transcriptional regulator [Candidatus Tectomicrobia bacterium]|nr:MerR family transcriptional regulator [Candidatus Tectomicrobia bacterium]